MQKIASKLVIILKILKFISQLINKLKVIKNTIKIFNLFIFAILNFLLYNFYIFKSFYFYSFFYRFL